MVWVIFNTPVCISSRWYYFPLLGPTSLCMCKSNTMKINELAPKVVVTLRNKAPVPLMDHIDNGCGISINGQWDDMK